MSGEATPPRTVGVNLQLLNAEAEAKRFADLISTFMRDEFTTALDEALAERPFKFSEKDDAYFGGPASRMQVPEDLTTKNLARVAREDEERRKKMEREAEESQQYLAELNGLLKDEFKQFVGEAIGGVHNLRSAFASLVKSLMESLAQKAGDKLIDRVVDFILPFHGGGIPVHAANGLIMSGVRGQDSVPAILRMGEMVTDTETTNYFKSVLPRLDRFISEPRSTETTIHLGPVHLVVEGGFNDPLAIRDAVNRQIMPEIARAVRYDTYSRMT
jgi:hypothetical protein